LTPSQTPGHYVDHATSTRHLRLLSIIAVNNLTACRLVYRNRRGTKSGVTCQTSVSSSDGNRLTLRPLWWPALIMGGQLSWAKCLSGNPSNFVFLLCACSSVVAMWKINSLSPPSRRLRAHYKTVFSSMCVYTGTEMFSTSDEVLVGCSSFSSLAVRHKALCLVTAVKSILHYRRTQRLRTRVSDKSADFVWSGPVRSGPCSGI